MFQAARDFPTPVNEPVLSYGPGTSEREELQATLSVLSKETWEMQNVINGERVSTSSHMTLKSPHDLSQTLGTIHMADGALATKAIDNALSVKRGWMEMSIEDRGAIILKAADLLTGPYRARMNAATMMGQSKTAHQAEIDSACELADFWRFNVHFAKQMTKDQPYSPAGMWNQVDYRPLDGFVFAVSPFNFTAIAANLPTAPALLGNVVLWKPSPTQAYSANVIVEILEEAGMPPGVINMLHGYGPEIGEVALKHPELGGVHFTGSTPTFQMMWKTVGENMANYRQYPRLVGETGGKDFIFAHPSADVDALAVGLVRGAFEFQGQKCSAASRAFIPKSLWEPVRERVEAMVKQITVGDVRDFSHFMGAVIDERSFDKISGFLDYAKNTDGGDIWLGGNADKSNGYFVDPTVVIAEDPNFRLMREEIFGPVLTMHCYDDQKFAETLKVCDEGTSYALTGAIFAQDRRAVVEAMNELRFAAGNFYINDKPTGAVVGQQPFGGGRASGTNDKAGSIWNLIRWASPRTVKETFNPPTDYRYPYMD